MTINRVLVANRGEIARRVFATCRRLGIDTVAVYSDADAGLPFVREADMAVRLPGNAPTDTYLRVDLILDAARRAGADAIHPGYGFLSENAGFARAVAEAGLTWIGPTPESIDRMGSKVEAKKLMEAAGVPVLGNLTPETATDSDLPVLVKASAGGGGRGMRIVRSLAELPGEIELARSEAESAFGDGTVFVEPYIEKGRHIEVQVVGDGSEVVVFGTRDCSLQRRHQKVVEEAPAPGLRDEVREAIHEAARAAAASVSYVGAGTVEFLYDADTERFFFLEMNTRLQVEHPVTEAIYGVDLVELQLAVAGAAAGAAGAAGSSALAVAGATTSALNPRGHAIEVRLYAEDPGADYQPQSGRLNTFEIPDVDVEFGALATSGIRLDSGFESGSEVGTYYDAMLAKVICWAPTREQASRRLAGVLQRARLHGPTTNRDQLVTVLRDEQFLAGDVSTALLGERDWSSDQRDLSLPAAAAALMLAEDERRRRIVQQGIPVGWRNVVSQPQRTRFEGRDDDLVVEWYGGRDGYSLDGIEVIEASPSRVGLIHDGVTSYFDGVIATIPGTVTREVYVDGALGSARLRERPRFVDPADQVAAGSLLAPMPGSVAAIAVEDGAAVSAGETVLVLEAMKMQHAIKAPADGVVSIPVTVGQQVAAGDVLAVVSDDQDPSVREQSSQEQEEVTP